MNINRGLSIVATSEDRTEFAHTSLTKDQLALDVGTHERRRSMIWVVEEWSLTE